MVATFLYLFNQFPIPSKTPMKKQKKERFADLSIQKLTSKGNGLGTYEHPSGIRWIIEAPFTMPGDKVKVKLTKKTRGIYQSKLEEILDPSKNRITPKCIHFATCGGCRWQHFSYEDQLVNKEAYIKDCFSSLLAPDLTFYPISRCETPWEYRNKMEFSFSENQAGDKFLGLMIDSSKGKVLNLTECHLVHEWFIDALKAVREWWKESNLEAYHPYKNTGTLRTLTLREGLRSGDRQAMLTVSGDPKYAIHKKQISDFVQALHKAAAPKENPDNFGIFVRIQQTAKGRPTEFFEMPVDGPDTIEEILHIQGAEGQHTESLKFGISPSAFFQPNTHQAEKIYSFVLQLAKIPQDAVVYDLYCGTGTLGICLAKHVKQVIGVELSRESAHDAKENIKLNGITNMKIISGSVGEVLAQLQNQSEIPPPDVVVVDPPRAGLDPQSIRLLLTLKPSTLVYVSCNPSTQASNVHELINGGYKLECLQPVDQFPQTVHVENIAILRRI